MTVDVRFKWEDVTKRYNKEYEKLFHEGNKQKLYFSFHEKVEGPKETWMLLSFVDGILQHLEPHFTSSMK